MIKIPFSKPLEDRDMREIGSVELNVYTSRFGNPTPKTNSTTKIDWIYFVLLFNFQ